MKSLVSTALLRGLLQSVAEMPAPTKQLLDAADALSGEDAIFMLDESYEIAKIFNTPTHQVVMLKGFEEVPSREPILDEEGNPELDDDFEEMFEVSYATSYQIKQIMFHKGVRIARAFGYEEEADRDQYWAKVGQQQAQEFVDATVKFIESNSDEDSDK